MTQFRNRLLSSTELITITKRITEVCADEQHRHCQNHLCECECHE